MQLIFIGLVGDVAKCIDCINESFNLTWTHDLKVIIMSTLQGAMASPSCMRFYFVSALACLPSLEAYIAQLYGNISDTVLVSWTLVFIS